MRDEETMKQLTRIKKKAGREEKELNNLGRRKKRKEKKKRSGKKKTKEHFKKKLEEGEEEIGKDYFHNYYLKQTEVDKVDVILNGMNSKEKRTNEKKEVRKNDVGRINTIKEVVGRRNKERRKKNKERENIFSLKEQRKRKILRKRKE